MICPQYSMMDVAPTVSAILGLAAPAQAKGSIIQEIVRDFPGVRKAAILAPDALGDFAWGLWQNEMPFLKSLHARRSIRLRSVMPSITPVNFAAMITGTDVSGHGIRAKENDFICETLFDVLRRTGKKSAGVGLEGYTGTKLLGRCADICGNVGKTTDQDIADKVVEIARRDAPDFMIAQLGRVDDVFHLHGPSSPQVVPMLKATDALLKKLIEDLKPLGYAVLILSDHGQHDVPNPAKNAKRGTHGTDAREDCLVPCTWT